MLLEFSVTNFRSFNKKQTFSMVASNNQESSERCVLETGFKAAPCVVETMSIYGANASGKSNIIKAMKFFSDFVETSSKDKQSGEEIDTTPFLFSKQNLKKPSEFEVVFTYENTLYQYGFTLDKNTVHEEWLYATPQRGERQSSQRWLEREDENIYVRPELKGPKKQWKELTRPNALFLSAATQMNSKDFEKPFKWITRYMGIIDGHLSAGYSAHQFLSGRLKNEITHFIKNLDVHIVEISVEEREINLDGIQKFIKEDVLKDMLKDMDMDRKAAHVMTGHKRDDGSIAYLDLDEESEGTKRLFSFLGPIFDTLEHGYTLIVDELQNSLHPIALKHLIELFQNKKINKNNAQLIFSTHDTNAMNILNKDQICFVEKNKSGETIIKALSNFKGERSDAYEKRYLSGRYGAIPNIGELVE